MASANKKGKPAADESGAAQKNQQRAQAIKAKAAEAKKSADLKKEDAKASKPAKAKKPAKSGFLAKAKTYFVGVRQEVKRVVWPSRAELGKYTGSVIGMLIVMGVLIYIVDSAVLPLLYSFSNLRG